MIKIQMPLHGDTSGRSVMHSEIDEDFFGYQENAQEVLSGLLTYFYGYPVRVTVQTDPEFTNNLRRNYYDAE